MAPASRNILWILAAALWLLFAPGVAADGKIFSEPIAAGAPSTPDQRALLHWSNGVERLVIETSFVGEGTNFAWLIPLPSEPVVEAVSTNFFKRLELGFQPIVVDRDGTALLALISFGGLFTIGLIQAKRAGKLLDFVVVILFLTVLFGMTLPALGHGGTVVQTASGQVSIIAREQVGAYETAVLKGDTGGAIHEWLTQNGFAAPTGAVEVMDDYVKEGWVFAAIKLARPDGLEAHSRPHPLAFTFATDKPVYPLRLTGQQEEDCSIELYVFGPSAASAAGFKVKHSGWVNESAATNSLRSAEPGERRDYFMPPKPGDYRVGNAEVRRFALPAKWVTKLSGELTPSMMERDAWLSWGGKEPAMPTVYSLRGAIGAASAWGAALFFSLALVVQLFGERLSMPTRLKFCVRVAVAAAIISVLKFATYDIVPITKGNRIDGLVRYKTLSRLTLAVGEAATNSTNAQEFHREVLHILADEEHREVRKNVFTGKLIRQSTAPGDFSVSSSTNGFEVFWHDINGNPQRIWPNE